MRRLILAGLMLLACQSPERPAASRATGTPESSLEAPAAKQSSNPAQRPEVEELPATALASAVERSNAASFAIWRAFAPTANFVTSPHGIRSASGLVYLAAVEGEGRNSFRAALHYPERNEDMDIRLLDSAVRATAKARFESANAIWVAKQTALSANYSAAVSQILPAEVHSIDFAANPALAQATINGWVSERTRGKIQQVLQGTSISKETRAVLVNAVSFSGQWSAPFMRELTSRKPFRTASGAAVNAQTMVGSTCLAAFEGTYQAAYAEYADTSAVLVVIVPKRWQDFRWNAAAFQRVWGALNRAQRAEFELPRFSLRSRKELGLVWRKLDLDVRDPRLLQGLLASDEPIGIDLAIHEAFFQVDETSTEAAAATAIGASAPISAHAPHPVFLVDRAFYFLLVERRTGLILFMGQVTNPVTSD